MYAKLKCNKSMGLSLSSEKNPARPQRYLLQTQGVGRLGKNPLMPLYMGKDP